MSKYPCMSRLHAKSIRFLSKSKSYFPDVVYPIYEAFTKMFDKIIFSLKSNFKIFTETIMPVKPPSRPIDALRDLFEDQQNQLNDLSQVIKTQSEKIKRLEDKNTELLKKESETKSGGWIFS